MHGGWHWFGFGNHRATKKPRAQSIPPCTNLTGISVILCSLGPSTFGSTMRRRQDAGQQLHEGNMLAGRETMHEL